MRPRQNGGNTKGSISIGAKNGPADTKKLTTVMPTPNTPPAILVAVCTRPTHELNKNAIEIIVMPYTNSTGNNTPNSV